MTETEFHAARRMFAAHKGTVLVAPADFPHTHREWFGEVFRGNTTLTDVWISEAVRGYVLGDRLVAYKGENFAHWVEHADVVAALAVMDALYLGEIQTVGLGARYAPGVQPWPARTEMSKAAYRSAVAARKLDS